MELGLGFHYQVLKSDKDDRHVAGLGIFHHLHHPVVDVGDAVPDPPVKVLGVLSLVIEWSFDGMVVHSDEVKPRQTGVKRVPDNANDLVALEKWSFRHHPRSVRFDDPDSIINDIFSFHSLHLKSDVHMKSVIATSLDSGQ